MRQKVEKTTNKRKKKERKARIKRIIFCGFLEKLFIPDDLFKTPLPASADLKRRSHSKTENIKMYKLLEITVFSCLSLSHTPFWLGFDWF